MGVYYEEIRDQQTEELIKTIDSRVYVQHPIGYIDEKYDAGNDRYTDGNGNGIKAQEIGLNGKKDENKQIKEELSHDIEGKLIYDELLKPDENGMIDSVRGELADFEVFIKKLDPDGSGKYNETPVEDFADYNKHIVILFDAIENVGYHSEVYEELNAVLDTVSYNYLSVKGFLPKYNLVGHSRGGVVNLMYATEHPYSVENLISIDTPYYGLMIADLFDAEIQIDGGLLSGYFSAVEDLFGFTLGAIDEILTDLPAGYFDLYEILFATSALDSLKNGGGQDFINKKESERLRNKWNETLATNPDADINALATGTAAGASYIWKMLGDTGGMSVLLQALSAALLKNPLYSLIDGTDPSLGSLDFAGENDSFIDGIIDSLGLDFPWLEELVGGDGGHDGELEQAGKDMFWDVLGAEINILLSILYGALDTGETLTNEILFAGLLPVTGSSVYNQLFSHLSLSDSVENTVFDVIAYCAVLPRLGKEIILALTPYLTALLPQIKEKLDPMIGFYDGELVLKSDLFIDLYSQLAPEFNGFDTYTKIYNEVNTAAKLAKDDLHNFSKYDPDILTIVMNRLYESSRAYGGSVFETAENGNEVTITGLNKNLYFYPEVLIIPEKLNGKTVAAIAGNAFENLKSLKTVIIDSENVSVSDGAFAGCDNITEFKLPVNNKYHTVTDGALYDKAVTKLIRYPSGKADESFAAPETVSELADYSLENGANLKSADLKNTAVIGKGVFSGCTELTDITADNLRYVADDGICDTKWFKNNENEYAVLGTVLLKYGGSDVNISISSDKYSAIGARAFGNAPNLESIEISGGGMPRINGLTFFGAYKLRYILIAGDETSFEQYEADAEWSKVEYPSLSRKITVSLYTDGNDGAPWRRTEVFYGGRFTVKDESRPEYELFPILLGHEFSYWEDADKRRYKYGDVWTSRADSFELYAVFTANEYIISYNYGGEVGVIREDRVIFGKELKDQIESMPAPTLSGYELAGWVDSFNVQYTLETIYGVADDTELFVMWKKCVYEITYIFENGRRMVEYDIRDDGYDGYIQLTDLSDDSLQKIHFKPAGWYANPDFKGGPYTRFYNNGENGGDASFFLKYELLIYALRFDAKNGNPIETISGTAAEIANMKMPAPTLGGYKGVWVYGEDKTISFGAIGYEILNGETLTANWEEKKFSECLNSPNNVYEIYTAGQLSGIEGDGISVKLMNDIYLTGAWTPIAALNGSFNGNGKTISNLNIQINAKGYSTQYFGLFEKCFGKISNLTLYNPLIYGEPYHISAWIYAGGVAGYLGNKGSLENVRVKSDDEERKIEVHRYHSGIGGLVGYSMGEIHSCSVEGLTVYGNGDMGSLVGFGNGTKIINCSAKSTTIKLNVSYENRSAGGIIGTAAGGSYIGDTAIYGVTVKFTGAGGIAGESLHPMMGLIVGQLDCSALYHVGKDGNCTLSSGTLNSDYKYGFLGLSKNDQTQYVGNKSWDCCGKLIGGYSIL
jgi:pimeloyl-ACP methyl ester carboxylesterase